MPPCSSSHRISTRCTRPPAQRSLIHMHGRLTHCLCAACGRSGACCGDLSVESICAACGRVGQMRPDVIWFGEMRRDVDRIYEELGACDLFVSMGTSGTVIRRRASSWRRGRWRSYRRAQSRAVGRRELIRLRRSTVQRPRWCRPSSSIFCPAVLNPRSKPRVGTPRCRCHPGSERPCLPLPSNRARSQ